MLTLALKSSATACTGRPNKNVSSAGMFALLYRITSAAFPTRVRATGLGLCAAVGRLGGIVAPVLGGALYEHLGRSATCLAFATSFAAATTLALGSLRTHMHPYQHLRTGSNEAASLLVPT